MALHIRCTYINATQGYMIGEDGEFVRAFTDDRGTLYRSCQQEYGRCVSKIYVDRKDKPPATVGWVFHGRDKYEDTGQPYLRETWAEVRDIPKPTD